MCYDYMEGRVLASKSIRLADIREFDQDQDFQLPFKAGRAEQLEFRTFWHGHTSVRQAFVKVTRETRPV